MVHTIYYPFFLTQIVSKNSEKEEHFIKMCKTNNSKKNHAKVSILRRIKIKNSKIELPG